MLTTAEESPLFGLIPYRVAVPLLLGLALLLTALLVFSLDRWHSALTESLLLGSPSAHVSRNDLVKVALMAVLLGATAVVSTLVLQRYRTTQRQLTEVQVLSRNILENMVGGVITLDLDGSVTVANPAACKMLELNAEQLSHGLAVLFDRQAELARAVKDALTDDRYTQDEDFAFTSSSGCEVWLRLTTSPLTANGHCKRGVVGLVKDVTRLRQMEQQLRRFDRIALTETLAAGVAHEIRNPLSAISLNLRLLQAEVLSPTPNWNEVRDYFDVVNTETKRLNRITEDFLAFSRPAPVSGKPVRIGSVLDRVVRLVATEAAEQKIRFRRFSEQVAPSVLGDAQRLEQVFLNVLVNAMESMPEGGEISISITSRRSDHGPVVDIQISDQGCGIPEDNLGRLFDPYFTTKPHGTGLGLAIARRMVSDHKGDIAVESSSSRGTTVRISFPAADSHWEVEPRKAS